LQLSLLKDLAKKLVLKHLKLSQLVQVGVLSYFVRVLEQVHQILQMPQELLKQKKLKNVAKMV
jgi:hypothetical protein